MKKGRIGRRCSSTRDRAHSVSRNQTTRLIWMGAGTTPCCAGESIFESLTQKRIFVSAHPTPLQWATSERVSNLFYHDARAIRALGLAQRARMYTCCRRSQLVCIGNRCLICWKAVLKCWSSMHSISKPSPGARRMSKMPSGLPNGTQHGLLKASFIPSGPQRELRELTRYPVRLTEEKAREVNRVQKTRGAIPI